MRRRSAQPPGSSTLKTSTGQHQRGAQLRAAYATCTHPLLSFHQALEVAQSPSLTTYPGDRTFHHPATRYPLKIGFPRFGQTAVQLPISAQRVIEPGFQRYTPKALVSPSQGDVIQSWARRYGGFVSAAVSARNYSIWLTRYVHKTFGGRRKEWARQYRSGAFIASGQAREDSVGEFRRWSGRVDPAHKEDEKACLFVPDPTHLPGDQNSELLLSERVVKWSSLSR